MGSAWDGVGGDSLIFRVRRFQSWASFDRRHLAELCTSTELSLFAWKKMCVSEKLGASVIERCGFVGFCLLLRGSAGMMFEE